MIRIIRPYLFFLLALLSINFSYGQSSPIPADSVSADGSKSFHGERISENDALPVGNLVNMGIEGKAVKVEGEVTAACQAKGCWMSVSLNEAQNMRVTFKDYAFFVPTNSAGKTAIFEGIPKVQTTSVEELRHYAVDGGMSEEEAKKTITEPKVEISFEATGVIIKEEK